MPGCMHSATTSLLRTSSSTRRSWSRPSAFCHDIARNLSSGVVSNQFTGLHGITVPGTLRDCLVLLAVVLAQQTELQPTQIMTDTDAYSDDEAAGEVDPIEPR